MEHSSVYKEFQKHNPKLAKRTKQKMDNFFQDDLQISYLCEQRSTEDICQEDTRQVFDFYISYTDFQISHRKSSLAESTQPSSQFILDSENVRPINAEIDLENDQKNFLVGQSYQNKLSKKSSIEFLVRIPSLEKSQQIITNPFLDDQEDVSSVSMEVLELQSEKVSLYIPCEEQVSILFDDQIDGKQKEKSKKPKRTQSRRVPKGIRKGKNYQSRTQKFFKYMTRFHFSKNFKQFLNKGIINHRLDPWQFPNFEVKKKIEIIDLIIGKEVKEYEMKMHYSVKKGNFLKSFGKNRTHIEDFFHQVVRRVYTLMFETFKRSLLYPEEKDYSQGYLDRKAEKQFDEAFDDILRTRPYYGQLLDCDFERILWKEIDG